ILLQDLLTAKTDEDIQRVYQRLAAVEDEIANYLRQFPPLGNSNDSRSLLNQMMSESDNFYFITKKLVLVEQVYAMTKSIPKSWLEVDAKLEKLDEIKRALTALNYENGYRHHEILDKQCQ